MTCPPHTGTPPPFARAHKERIFRRFFKPEFFREAKISLPSPPSSGRWVMIVLVGKQQPNPKEMEHDESVTGEVSFSRKNAASRA